MLLLAAGGLFALDACSLLLPWAPSFDPWGWILWGREITHPSLIFNTSGYPSWKPLPVAFTALFSLAGGLSPALWLVLARAGALASLGLAYVLASRLGGRMAGFIAVIGIVLIPDWLGDFAGGASEPLLSALVMGAIERHLGRRPGQALALLAAASLLRPEAWPFLLGYGAWRAGRDSGRWVIGALLLVLIPAAWLVPEWIGAGDPLHGSKLAQASHEAHQTRILGAPLLRVAWDGLGLLILPLWLGACVAVVRAQSQREPLPLWLAATALAWMAMVLSMTAIGYAGIARFMIPAAVLASVTGAIGGVWVARDLLPGRTALAGLLLVAALVPFAVPRAVALRDQARTATTHHSLQRQLATLMGRLGGRAGVGACGPVLVESQFRGTIAWRLDVPEPFLEGAHPRLFLVRVGHPLPGFRRSSRTRPRVQLASAGPWRAIWTPLRGTGGSVQRRGGAPCAHTIGDDKRDHIRGRTPTASTSTATSHGAGGRLVAEATRSTQVPRRCPSPNRGPRPRSSFDCGPRSPSGFTNRSVWSMRRAAA